MAFVNSKTDRNFEIMFELVKIPVSRLPQCLWQMTAQYLAYRVWMRLIILVTCFNRQKWDFLHVIYCNKKRLSENVLLRSGCSRH